MSGVDYAYRPFCRVGDGLDRYQSQIVEVPVLRVMQALQILQADGYNTVLYLNLYILFLVYI